MSQRLIEELVFAQHGVVSNPVGNGSPQWYALGLNSLALQSLVSLFDEKEKLFFQRITVTENGLSRQGTSLRGTIIALLGVQRLAESGVAEPFDTASIREAVWRDSTWVRSIGDLGLLTWFTALCEPERLGVRLDAFNFGKALESYPDGRQGSTTELAWFLTGIAHARLACPGALPDLTDVAAETYHLLLENQSESGIFGHAASPISLRKPFCKRFGTFADQAHAIYALSIFARAFEIEEPLEPALNCAKALCALQGEMGQWWRLYDARTCRVVNQYPVFSCQQDGIAPAALLALGEATCQSFDDSIYKGLSWIAGANELAIDLRDSGSSLIWDSIGPRRPLAKYWEVALSFMGFSRGLPPELLKIRFEARPEHFGWLLYAFGKFGVPAISRTQPRDVDNGRPHQIV